MRMPTVHSMPSRWLVGALVLLGAALPLCAQVGPRLLFTDIASGPGTGGENGLGAFLTIHGEGFGPTQGGSTVTIGGQPVSRVVSWGQDNAVARRLDRIVVQPGPGAASGDIVVTVGGQASNPLPFTVRSGNIYFVDQASGNDANPGTRASPWATIWRPRQTMVAGDIVYVIGGTFTQLDPATPGWDTMLFLDASLGVTGTAAAPIAYLGYPGNPPIFVNPAARRGVYLNQDSGPLGHHVIGNMRFGTLEDAFLVTGVGHRIVANDLTNGGVGHKIGIFGDTSAIDIHGNLMNGNGTPTTKYYGIYIQGFGANQNIDVGWNEIRNQEGRSIQVYGHLTGDVVDDLRIHDNLFVGSELNNVLLGGSDGANEILGTVHVTGNVIAGARGAEGLRVNDPTATVIIDNNTFHGNAVAQVYLEEAGAGRITLRDNIVVAEAGEQYYEFDVASSPASFVPSRNLVWGAGACAAWDIGCINQDPLFAAAADYHLQAGSPAIDAGIATSAGRDHDGVLRPQGAAYDVGAYEWTTAAAPVATYLSGEGLGAPNPNLVRLHDAGGAYAGVEFYAYAAGQWGVNVSAGPIDAVATDEIVTGPGPGAVFGPHVRAFSSAGTSLAKVSFYAYGTLKYGVNTGTERLDADGYDEILTGAGAGQVFGPHVRAFDYDGAAVTAIAKVSFFAYGTLRYGVNVEGGRLDADAYAEILTAPGPGPMFGPQVRGFDWDAATVAAMSKINFNAFTGTAYGATAAAGDADLDGFAEIAASPGPGATHPCRFLGFNYDGSAITALAGLDTTPYGTLYGGRAALGSVPQDGRDDLVCGAGPAPAADSTVRAFRYAASALTPYPAFVAFPGAAHGVNATAGDLD